MEAVTISRGGGQVTGFALGEPPRPSECACNKVLRRDEDGQLGSIAVPVATAVSPWALAFTTSVVGAATGWAIEEIARRARVRRR